jgi:hypothetical protein
MIAKYGKQDGDRIWNREKNKHEATAVLKQKIQQWSKLSD